MEWNELPPGQQIDSTKSPRFSQIATFARLPYSHELNGVGMLFIGIPFDDGTTFRTGARFGPRAIREASRMLRRYNPILDVKPFETLGMIDYGDVDVVPGYIDDTYREIENTLTPIFRSGIVPVACGGDHSISLAILRAAVKKYGKLGLVHFDAHLDYSDQYFGKRYNHGTPFRRADEEGLIDPKRSVHVGIRGSRNELETMTELKKTGSNVIPMDEFVNLGLHSTTGRIRDTAKGHVYVTLDIDAVDPAYAPGTGTPEVGGFTSRELIFLVRGLSGLNIIGFDLVEVSPPYDSSEITAFLASNLIYEFCSVLAKEHVKSTWNRG